MESYRIVETVSELESPRADFVDVLFSVGEIRAASVLEGVAELFDGFRLRVEMNESHICCCSMTGSAKLNRRVACSDLTSIRSIRGLS